MLKDLVPEQYGAAILTSLAAGLSMVLLLVLVWRINSMEKEIHDLTLRDELTGLYNMRGFYLLGEQTLRLAQRAELPFSVLFIDLDGLKKINDEHGPQHRLVLPGRDGRTGHGMLSARRM